MEESCIAVVAFLMDELLRFLSADYWVPRWHCGWFPWWLIVWICSVATWTCVSYIRIPLAFKKAFAQDGSPFGEDVDKLLTQFILFCGIGHVLMEAVPFAWPHYLLLSAGWGTLVAWVSHKAANAISWWANHLVDTKRRMESLRKENAVQASSILELQQTIDQLREAERGRRRK